MVGATPPCSRCRRLGISCIGFGKQRFKFIDAGDQLALASRARSKISNHGHAEDSSQPMILGSPSPSLSNRLTRLLALFVSNIDSSADISIQLPWNFGGFLAEIPRRLGTNEALDAASEALMTSYTHFIAGDAENNPDILTKHSMALSALRRTLDDPVKALSSETLCSTMVLQIVHVCFALIVWLINS